MLWSGRRLLGREREREVLDRLLDGVNGGHGGVLVMRGDAGVGKTALLEYAVEAGRGFRIARTSGVEAEMELPFAAAQQLCSPFFELLERLPQPQHDALGVAFGLSTGPAPNAFLVGLAVLGLLAEAAEEQPLICVVDDAQWLDSASARTLAFVARRLLAEKIALVFATRALGDALAGSPELHVAPLGRRDARALLESVLPARLDEGVLERIVAETEGNPLALLELPRGLSPTQLAGGFGLPGTLPLSASIEEGYTRRLARLPQDARRLLLVAAADPVGDPALVWRAAERLGIPESAAQTVESEDLLVLSPRVVFRHPLVRSAVYGAARLKERRDVHRALADATDPVIDPDRRAWHRAQGASIPDEDVAAELERSAARAQARGGLAAAAAFLERAVALSPEPSRRAQRALAAAQTKFEAGALDDALDLLETAESGTPVDDLVRARVHLLRAQIAFVSRRGSDATPLLLAAARELEPVAPNLARATYLEALSAARFAGPLADVADLLTVSQAALAGPPMPPAPRPSDLLLQGLAVRSAEGYAAAAPLLKVALSAFERETPLPPEEARWLSLALWAAADLWDDETWRRLTIQELERARESGALTAIPLALGMLSYIHATSGQLVAAESLLNEIRAAAEVTGIPAQPYLALWIAALRGRETETRGLIQAALGEAALRGEGYATFVTEHVTAVLYNGLGRYGEALAALRRQAVDPSYRDGSPRPMAEVIEAAVRSGEPQLAQLALAQLAETTTAAGTDWALGIEARSRALLSDGEPAETLYLEAIERLGRTGIRFQLARAHLLYGEWLRRERRRLDARGQLRTAHEFFSEFGVEAFAKRARVELEATGLRARKRTVDTLDQLTPQETQIARLAAEGHTNREIAARLFISASTVEYHLRKAFRKLEVKSRTQLEDRLS
jgi:DNA-binding CsgD family transcriptional regulator/tetratricopeptide (TPR) repeat protein